MSLNLLSYKAKGEFHVVTRQLYVDFASSYASLLGSQSSTAQNTARAPRHTREPGEDVSTKDGKSDIFIKVMISTECKMFLLLPSPSSRSTHKNGWKKRQTYCESSIYIKGMLSAGLNSFFFFISSPGLRRAVR